MLARLERDLPFPGAARCGITGAPGSGKSTLLDALVRALRPRGETLGIVAVDPSSRRSGGALLGDRFRVRSGAGDPGVYLRSMAARERLGGLAEATWSALLILAAVFDRVFVETVGVGQSEAEVAGLVDSLVYVVNPGTGDTLQFMKAGILELPDVFVVNKADCGAAARVTAGELESGLALGEVGEAGWSPPVLLTSASDGTGVAALVDALDAHRRHLLAGDGLRERRRRAREVQVLDCLERRWGSRGLELMGGSESIRARVRDDERIPVFEWISRLERELEDALRKPRG
jgi:LAO/AO transport system kinase